MIKFIDANIFIGRWDNPKAEQLTNLLDREQHCTSVLVLIEVEHKLRKKKVENIFDYIRGIMGSIPVFDVIQEDLFNALKNNLNIDINDKIHIAVMKRNNIHNIISLDRDFDKEKSIQREEL